MSGVAGGNRNIPISIYKEALSRFYFDILLKHPKFRAMYPTGSFHDETKWEFGDIDIVCLFNITTKKELAEWLESFPDDIIKCFPTGKYKGNRTHKTGNIICVLFNYKEWNIQIDIVFTTSFSGYEYKIEYLNLPAEKQALIAGLVRVHLLEHDESHSKLMHDVYDTEKDFGGSYGEFEYVMTPVIFQLRYINYDENYNEMSRYIIWDSYNWKSISGMLTDIDITLPFEELLESITFKYERSRRRVLGLFKAQVVINNGESGTPKGDRKLACIKMVEDRFGD